MSRAILFFLLLFSNYSFADKREEFFKYLNESVSEFEVFYKRLNNYIFFLGLKDNPNAEIKCKEYFGDITYKKEKILKNILSFFEKIKNDYSKYIDNTNEMIACNNMKDDIFYTKENDDEFFNENDKIRSFDDFLSMIAFRIYTYKIGSIKKIENWIDYLELDDEKQLKKDMDSIIKKILNVQDYFNKFDQNIVQFLKIDCLNLNNNKYNITVNIRQLINDLFINIDNIESLLKKIDLDKLKINEDFKKLLKQKHSEINKIINVSKKYNTKTKMYKGDMDYYKNVNLSVYDGELYFSDFIVRNYKNINIMYKFILDPLSVSFDVGSKIIKLSDEEILENRTIFLDMIQSSAEMKADVKIDTPKQRLKKTSNKKSKPKPDASKREIVPIYLEECVDVKKEEIERSENIIENKHIVDNSNPELAVSLNDYECKIEEEIDITVESPVEESKNWLKNIMLTSATKNGDFDSIFRKANALYKQLENHEIILLDQIQQATSELALRLQRIMKSVDSHDGKLDYVIPKNYEDDFRFLMYTPICYLNNNIRFGFVKRVIEGLGGNVDVARAGSRIALHLNGHTAGLHIHDSVNGLLDGGRLTSLRKFLINAGFVIKDY